MEDGGRFRLRADEIGSDSDRRPISCRGVSVVNADITSYPRALPTCSHDLMIARGNGARFRVPYLDIFLMWGQIGSDLGSQMGQE